MIAQLILATGSHAGVAASIQLGYYMIGRHGECQIRPKSRSVSRRHCILHHTETQLLALDLDSSSGTCINGEKITVNRWVELKDGDQLRCGKVVFDVSIKTTPQQSSVTSGADELVPAIADAADDTDAASNSEHAWPAESMLQGEAWQEFDVADMLHSADDSDREQRYKAIRAISELKSDDSSLKSGNLSDAGTLSEEGDTLTDEPSTTADTLRLADDEPASESRAAESRSSESKPAPAKLEKTKKVKADTSGTHDRKSKKPRQPLRMPSISLPSDFESLKLVGAILISIVVIGLFSYSVYRFQAGPPVKIVKGIE
ncbi:Forkhead-associated protein [Rhodopirellula maiorica SM1]|uniref:Forkhead-associated protein n=2 Tax=Novipirellula TaxID=2795426 RepID=M5RLD7_9BACT|nr:Forkhead-associated protein [Rhodopirellula maiorica SM1]